MALLYLKSLSKNRAVARIEKFILFYFIICGFILGQEVWAQQIEENPLYQQIKIKSADWYAERDVGEPVLIRKYYHRGMPEGESANLPSTSSSPKKDSDKFIYRIKVQNLSDKEIVSIIWRYNFYNPETKELLASREFESHGRIKPNKRRTLYAESSSPPTHVLDVKLFLLNKREPYLESVTVRSIVFKENSDKFQNPIKKKIKLKKIGFE